MSAAIQRLAQFRADMPFFSRNCLKIRTKAGTIVPLVLNPVQQLIHDRLERQKREKGFIRALILKARQPGCSTYIAARYYHRTSLFVGQSTYILTHEQPASDNLFDIVERYQHNNPIAPHVGTSNIKELEFDQIDSNYVVATAGQKAGGRGRSITMFHGSEVAFWPNAADHFSASVQAVPLLPGTEVVLESTANGPSGEFYERCQDAEAGRGDYILIFVPWFMTEEYQRVPEPGFTLDTEGTAEQISEAEIADMYGLSLAQMAWRRNKIIELRSVEKFQQEYPSDSTEAFVAANHQAFIPAINVLRARKSRVEGAGPLILGVDPASGGGDRFAVAARRGAKVEWVKYREKVDPVAGHAWIKSLIDEHQPARVNIDAGSIGGAIISMLKASGPLYLELVRAVNFGGTSQTKLAKPKKPGPTNRRAEMWERCRDWLAAEEGASIPDLPELQSDLTAPRMKPKLNNDFLLESKVEMKARQIRSPDLADAVCLTFASKEFLTDRSEPRKDTPFGEPDTAQRPNPVAETGGYSWMA